MTSPSYLQPFVLPEVAADRARHGDLDVYRSAAPEGERRPVVVLVHGGPLPAAVQPSPREWPVYRGYACMAAERAMIAVMLDHRLHSPADYPLAAADIASAVEQAQSLPDADPHRVALWFFSGGALLAAEWLAAPPPWLRGIAMTYPLLAPLPDWDVDPRFRPVAAAGTAGGVPLLVTKVGRERPDVAADVDAFLTAANASRRPVQVIEVPDGQHGFDYLDHTDESRAAVTRAVAWVSERLAPHTTDEVGTAREG